MLYRIRPIIIRIGVPFVRSTNSFELSRFCPPLPPRMLGLRMDTKRLPCKWVSLQLRQTTLVARHEHLASTLDPLVLFFCFFSCSFSRLLFSFLPKGIAREPAMGKGMGTVGIGEEDPSLAISQQIWESISQDREAPDAQIRVCVTCVVLHPQNESQMLSTLLGSWRNSRR